jgi:phage terminase small subunit
MKLSTRRQRFVNAYMGEAAGNATKAAILAGYSEHTARQAGSRLLTLSDVRDAVGKRQERLQDASEVSAQRIIKELSTIAFSDIRGLFDETGKLRPVHELPDDVAHSLASIEVMKERTIKGAEITTHEAVHKLKTWDKTKALEMLGRHLALWQDRNGADSGRVVVNIGFLQQPDAGQPAITVSSQVMGHRASVALLHQGESGESQD